MSFRGGRSGSPSGRSFSGRSGSRGGGRDGGGRGGFVGRGGGRGGRGSFEEGPPAEVCEVGVFLHSAEGEMVCRLTNAMIPYFNAGVYLHNKSKIGKIEEVFGPINRVYFTVKPDMGVNAASFQVEDKVFIGTDKLLPLSRFTNEGKSGGGAKGGRGSSSSRGGGRGGPGRAGGRAGGGRGGFGRGGGGGFSRGGGRSSGGFGRGSGRGRG